MNNLKFTWFNDVEQSDIQVSTFCKDVGVSCKVFKDYCLGFVEPREKTILKIQSRIDEVKMFPKIEKHPSYGYATKEEVDRLN